MPALNRLVISGIRNIGEATISPSSGFNVIYGDNGSGKTSVLEAICLLSLGRSFRTHQQKPLIQEGLLDAAVYGETEQGLSLGVQKTSKGASQVKINGTKTNSLSDLAREFPVQILNSDAFRVFEGSPGDRRAFMDWGVFHVKHQFLDAWRKARRALSNRNVLLKQNAKSAELEPWTHELALHSMSVHRMRKQYLSILSETLQAGLAVSLEPALGGELGLTYYCGWDEERDLTELLIENTDRDRRYGHTSYGPHRADLKFLINAKDCVDTLSRGQLKLFISALKIAQARQLNALTGKHSIFLVDDLPSELDRSNQERICHLLGELQSQVFITAIETTILSALPRGGNAQRKLFHVKHGKMQEQLDAQ